MVSRLSRALGGMVVPLLVLSSISADRASGQDHQLLPDRCADLTVIGNGPPGSTLTFYLSGGAAHAPAILALAWQTGTTRTRFGSLGTLELGLARPIIPIFIASPTKPSPASRASSTSIGSTGRTR